MKKIDRTKIEVFFADYETQGRDYVEKHLRVDTWGCFISNQQKTKSNLSITIEDMLDWLFENGKETNLIYFHNGAKFDHHFTVHSLFKKHLQIIDDKKDFKMNEGNCINIFRTDDNRIMSITIKYNNKTFMFKDTALIIPSMKLEDMLKEIGADLEKGKTRPFNIIRDYKTVEDMDKTEDGRMDKKYLMNDVYGLIEFFDKMKEHIDLKTFPLTTATYARTVFMDFLFNKYKEKLKGNTKIKRRTNYINTILSRRFPLLREDLWEPLKEFYHGGFTMVAKNHNNKVIEGKISQWDVNSHYPAVMSDKPMPTGYPIPKGKMMRLFGMDHGRLLINSANYETYFELKLYSDLVIKPGFHPFLGVSNTMNKYKGAEYNERINHKEIPILKMTACELRNVIRYYDGRYKIEPKFCFRTDNEFLPEFFNYFKDLKNKGGSSKFYAKLIINAIYGKFGQKPYFKSKRYIHNGGFIVDFENVESEIISERQQMLNGEVKPKLANYIPLAISTTAWAKSILVKTIQENKERFIYCDTDSVHLLGTEPPVGVEIHDDKFGAWSPEWPEQVYGNTVQSLYAGAKRYMVLFDKINEKTGTNRITKIAGITNKEWKTTVSPNILQIQIDMKCPIEDGCLQKRSYIKDPSTKKNKPLKGVYLIDIDKILR